MTTHVRVDRLFETLDALVRTRDDLVQRGLAGDTEDDAMAQIATRVCLLSRLGVYQATELADKITAAAKLAEHLRSIDLLFSRVLEQRPMYDPQTAAAVGVHMGYVVALLRTIRPRAGHD